METDRTISEEQAKFVEEKTKATFDYVIDCLDRAKADGNTVLQWLFGVITGGLAFIGGLFPAGYHSLTFGMCCAVAGAALAAWKLVPALGSKETVPPGNLAKSLNTLLDEPMPRMRWREANGMDDRIEKNLAEVGKITTAVDKARRQFAAIPFWFIVGFGAAYCLINYYPAS